MVRTKCIFLDKFLFHTYKYLYILHNYIKSTVICVLYFFSIIAVSQMQPTDARKSLPCFDEPALKASFDISLWHKDPYYALSNMPNTTTEVTILFVM